VITLGVILLIIGFLAKIAILWTIGIVLVVIGLVLALLGMMGRAVGASALLLGGRCPQCHLMPYPSHPFTVSLESLASEVRVCRRLSAIRVGHGTTSEPRQKTRGRLEPKWWSSEICSGFEGVITLVTNPGGDGADVSVPGGRE
jgi:hypothetical protein